MKITEALKGELAQWLEIFWTTYIKGDYDRWSTFITEDYYNIGGTKEEIWHSKQEILNYSYAMQDQMVGQAEIRNREIEVLPYGDYLMVNEFTDLFVKIEGEWTYYGPFRMSSLLSKTDTGWVALHQHGSYPDMKATEGEAFAADVLKAENKRLQEAVDQRTTELLLKNRELEIEAALEKVRSRSLAMHATSELQEVIHAVHQELIKLDIGIFGGSFIAINSEIEEELHCWGAGGTADTSDEVHIPYFDKPFYTNLVKRLKGGPSFFTEEFTHEEKKAFFTFLFTKEPWSNLKANEKKEILSSPGGYTRSCSVSLHTSIFIINQLGNKFSEEENYILKRFGKVFEQSYTRFLDLQKAEAQARESQIEVALEKVRSASMAMHKSEELVQVVRILDKQILGLGIEVEGTQIITDFANAEDGLNDWLSEEGQDYLEKFHVPFIKHPSFNKLWTAVEKGADFYTETYSKTDKDEYLKLLFKFSDFKSIPKERQNFAYNSPGMVRTIVLSKNSILIFPRFDLKGFSKEENAILQRFGKVFEQSYARFLDLQKAEAQAREAQIEASLERVRASMMAMHRSDELLSISTLISEEMMKMGVIDEYNRVAFALLDDEKEELTLWITELGGDRMNKSFVLPYDFEPSFVKTLEIFHKLKPLERKEHNHIRTYIGEELIAYTNRFIKAGVVSPEIMTAIENGSLPNTWYDLVSFFAFGLLTIGSFQKITDEQKDVAKRFAKVFEQTYTRFLDLQKAEAQAREVQIEAALERVRSRTMGMQNSSELKDVIQVVYQQFVGLGIPVAHTGFIMDYKDREDMNIWLADSNQFHSEITFPYFDSPHWNSFLEAKSTGENFFANLLDFKTKNRFYQSLFALIPDLSKETQDFYFAQEGLSISTVLLDNVGLYIENYSTAPFTPEENQVLMRFGKVFQQTYTRFLDLQKAEARALESQIETALERVRSRTMGMQQSEELGDVATVLFNEMNGLVDDLWTCGFVLCEENRQEDEWWLSMDTGFTRGFFLPNVGDFAHETLYEGWKKRESFRSVELEGKMLNDHYEWLMKVPIAKQIFADMEASGIPRPKWQKLNAAYFKTGYLVIITEVPCAEEEIFKRFAQVFDLTYTRFLDLQQKEEQGKKLVEEKLRLELTLKDLQATQAQLIQSEKMASLGELTAGIAHEIQNPLNFVNNFAEVSGELVDEMNEELEKGDIEEAKAIGKDLKENLSKINHHGKRADAIVKGMLEHSRANKGEKAPTDLNALADEFVRLSYHGLRAKDKSFNADFKLELDPNLPKVNVVASDIGRVILNLVNNGFYAVNEKAKSTPQPSRNIGTGFQGEEGYKPEVVVKTTLIKSTSGDLGVQISVQDNGPGIPDHIKEKIFQPFFTTKPTGSGTGLGLSLSYDIVKAHGGELEIETSVNKGTTFIIKLSK
jgi:signal transduction histidine kinase